MSARVWVAEPGEAETVARLLVDFRNHLGVEWPSDNAFLAGVERLIETRDAVYVLGSPDDDSPPAAVAQVRFRYGIWWAAEDCLIEDLFVRESARGSGLGRALVGKVVELALERRCRRIELDVNDNNAAALALYRGLGFTNDDPRYGGGNLFMRLRLEARP
jgi:ribosomal protein S18 acetylase RimI-like enzyme